MKGHSHRGFSLVELMIALVIGLLLVAAVVTLMVDSRRNQSEVTESARMIENGRYALTVLAEDIQHAGFYGNLHQTGTLPGTLPDPCQFSLTALNTGLALPIQGYEGNSSSPISCIASADYLPNTDILVIRRTSTEAATTLAANEIYLQSRGLQYVLDTGSNAANFVLTQRDGTTPAAIRKLRVHIYFVSPCSVPVSTNCSAAADGGNPIPTLKRLELTTDGSAAVFSVVPLVEGVENLQVDYGIDRSGDGSPNASGTGTNDAYVSIPATVDDWSQVVTLRLHLLARQIARSSGHTDSKSYVLGLSGSVGPFSDSFRRHVFTSTVRAINPSSRRGG